MVPAPLAPPVAVPLESVAPIPAASVAPAPAPAAAPVAQPAAPLLPPDDGSTPMRDVPLGTLIFRAGLLAEEQLEDALQEGMRSGKRLGEVLLERGWLHERDLGRLLAGQKGLPFVEIHAADAEPAALQLLPEEKARLQIALPLRFEEGQLVVAVADPSNELVLENLRRSLGHEPRLVVAPQGELIRAIGDAYTGVVAPQEPTFTTFTPEPEPTLAPEPTTQPEPTFTPEQTSHPEPAPAPVVVTPLPTVLPPEEARDAQPVNAPVLQPPVIEPAAFVVDQPSAVEPALPAPPVEETLAPLLEQPALQPEPNVVPEPITPLVEPSVEAQPAPPEPLTPIAPLQPPVQVEVTAPQPMPEPPSEPLLAPPAAEQPLQGASVPFEQVTAPAPLPPPVPVEAPVERQPAAGPGSIHVVLLRLRDGEAVEVGTFTTAIEASARAQEVVQQIATAEGDAGWPFFGERYLRPDAIVSVDLLEESADKWLGSAARTRWANEGSA